MDDWDALLKELADDPDDYDRQHGEVLFLRQGREYNFSLREIPGAGLSVEVVEEGRTHWLPLDSYVQRDLLGLPRLAAQVIRAVDRLSEKRPGKFIEGPAVCETGGTHTDWDAASRRLREFLLQPEPGSTRLIQLMAPAGQGKTVLLENSALEFARAYQPEPHPSPILLNVDLLGRYVGTVDDAIAGSLNNSYLFPGLSQRDVALCVRRRWL